MAEMLALSIRQPWAWLITRPDLAGAPRAQALAAGLIKDVENRSWPTRYRGPILIHASKTMTRDDYEDAEFSLWYVNDGAPHGMPPFDALQRGGIVGRARLVDCRCWEDAESPWHVRDQFGFYLKDIEPLPFRRCRGRLGFFPVELGALEVGHG